MSGKIVKYPPIGAGPTPPPLPLPPTPAPPPLPPPPAPSPVPPPTTVAPNDVVEEAVQAQINYSNMLVGYFKIDLYKTMVNMYGESVEKWYYPPVEVKCLIDRGDYIYTDTEFGPDVNQTLKVTIPKLNIDASGLNFTPEVGDIITDQEKYYEVHTVTRSTITLPGNATNSTENGTPGYVILYVLEAHLTRTTKINLIQYS
jgi:hypothetical protein